MTTLIDYLGMWKIENQETISFSFLDTVEALLIGYYKDVTTSLEQVEDKDSLSFMLATLADRLYHDSVFIQALEFVMTVLTTLQVVTGIEAVEGSMPDKGESMAGGRPGATEDVWQFCVGGWRLGCRRV
ncbi:hypothetical protein GIB67_023058 [Kingdonia uniflora]|uniref:Uncharacterized protein n=1 Tax=Kingdonia uniflora TaxID=39325 RepID=A0A7J7ME92_9MAGN|nr:hypothetical protein GIB67_023058 [Kingdonia uniflora]